MKIGIVAKYSDNYSTHRLIKACEDKNHVVDFINVKSCYMNITSKSPIIHYKGELLSDYDVIIPRIEADITFYGTSVVRQFEMMGVYSLNRSIGISRSRDKLRLLQTLAGHGIELPKTGYANSPDDIQDAITIVGGAPVVIKLLEDTYCTSAILAKTDPEAKAVLESYIGLKNNILVQEYIQESYGATIRCFVIGDKVVSAIKREASNGEFISNSNPKGNESEVELSAFERHIAIQATRVVGLNIAGVDLLRAKRGPVIIDVNSSPGFEDIEKITSKDIASMIIEYIENNAKELTQKAKSNL